MATKTRTRSIVPSSFCFRRYCTLAKGLCSISFIQSNDTVLDFGSGVGQNIFDGSCVGKMFLLSIESPSLLLPSSSCSLSSDNNGTR